MSERKELGRIKKCNFGMGGYQEAMIGISFELGGECWGVCDFWGNWAIKRTDSCKWTESDRITQLGETAMRIAALLKEAKRERIDQLVGVPVEVIFEGMMLKSWRVLKEVL